MPKQTALATGAASTPTLPLTLVLIVFAGLSIGLAVFSVVVVAPKKRSLATGYLVAAILPFIAVLGAAMLTSAATIDNAAAAHEANMLVRTKARRAARHDCRVHHRHHTRVIRACLSGVDRDYPPSP